MFACRLVSDKDRFLIIAGVREMMLKMAVVEDFNVTGSVLKVAWMPL